MNPRPRKKKSSRKNHRLRVPGVRWLPGILIFLLLGAILNVAVAWGLCLGGDPTKAYNHKVDIDFQPRFLDTELERVFFKRIESSLYLITHGGWDHPSLSLDSVIDTLTRGSSAVKTWEKSWPNPRNRFSLIAVGWPAFSMWFERSTDRITGENWAIHGLMIKQLPAWNTQRMIIPRTLPLGILFRGFIFNTFFYAMILWVLFPGRYMLRRHRRIRRGRCGQCGYIVAPNIGVPGASPNCPECGTPISPGTPIPGKGKR